MQGTVKWLNNSKGYVVHGPKGPRQRRYKGQLSPSIVVATRERAHDDRGLRHGEEKGTGEARYLLASALLVGAPAFRMLLSGCAVRNSHSEVDFDSKRGAALVALTSFVS